MASLQFLCSAVLIFVPLCSGNVDISHRKFQARLEYLEKRDREQSFIIQQLQQQLLTNKKQFQPLSTTNINSQQDFQYDSSTIKNIFNTDSRSTQVINTDYIVQELREEMESLRAEVETTHKLVSHLQSQVQELKTEAEEKGDKVEQMKFLIKEQANEIASLKSIVQKVTKTNTQNKPSSIQPKMEQADEGLATETLNNGEGNNRNRSSVLHQSNLLKNPAYDITGANRRFITTEGPVGFHAVSDTVEIHHLGVNQNIVFGTTLLNIGGGYHNLHGLFTAPKAGLYLFSASLTSWKDTHPHIFGGLVKNGVILANICGTGGNTIGSLGDHNQGSVSVVTQLNVGDEVWVKNELQTDAYMWGNKFVSFTGILVTEM